MEQSKEHQVIKPLLFRGVVWALESFIQDKIVHIAAGFGSWLYLYKLISPGKWILILKQQPFRDRDKIIEIRHYSHSRLLLVASDRFKFYHLQGNKLHLLLSKQDLADFILDVSICETEEARYTLAYGHNFIQEYENSELKKTVACEDNSVIFCIRLSPFNSFVASGTVFSEILVWNTVSETSTSPVSVRLKGHLGVIFRITWINPQRLVSVSDDRSVRVWNLQFANNTYTGNYSEIWMKFGHNVRVWDAIYIQGQKSAIVATVSQDASCKTWDASTGKQIDHFRGHQGKNVWRVTGFASDNHATIITGGEDGSLKVWRSKFTASDLEEQKLQIEQDSVITHSLPMPQDQILAQALQTLKNFKPLIKGVVMAASQKIYCCTNYGAVYEVNYTKEEISSTLVYNDPNFENFTELLLWGENRALLSHSNGECSLISLPSHELLQQWQCEQIRITNLYALTNQLLLSTTGIGAFSIWKYNDKSSKFEIFCKCALPLKSSVLGAYYNSQSSLLFCGSKTGKVYCFSTKISENNQDLPLSPINQIILHKDRLHGFYSTESKQIVVSFAKDSQIKQNKIDSNSNTLHTLSSIKVPLVNLIHQVFPTSEGFYVYGFDGAKLVLTNTSTCQEIFSIKCGGGHRPNEAIVISENEFYVAYSKSNTLTVHFKQNKDSFESYSITPSFHGREVLAACFYNIQKKRYLLTAAQDTLLQVHQIHQKQGMLDQIQVLNFHIGSVRCIEKVVKDKNTFILTGGGRMVLNLFVVNQKSYTLEHIQKFVLRDDQDYRIMSITATILQQEIEELKQPENNEMLAFLGTTSGQVLGLRYSFKLRKIETIFEDFYGSTVLKVKMVKLTKNDAVLISGLNNGQVVIQHFLLSDLSFSSQNKKTSQIHQMGINGLQVQLKQENLVIFSAADDQTVNMTSYNPISHQFKNLYSVELAHHSAIKDLSIWGNKIATCGYDQRLKLWKIEENQLILLEELYTCLGDMNGSAINEGLICLCGQGIELLSFY